MWLCAKKLSLNVQKSNLTVFHPLQRKPTYTVNLKIIIRQELYVKSLGIYLDCNLNWKIQIHQVAKNIKVAR